MIHNHSQLTINDPVDEYGTNQPETGSRTCCILFLYSTQVIQKFKDLKVYEQLHRQVCLKKQILHSFNISFQLDSVIFRNRTGCLLTDGQYQVIPLRSIRCFVDASPVYVLSYRSQTDHIQRKHSLSQAKLQSSFYGIDAIVPIHIKQNDRVAGLASL